MMPKRKMYRHCLADIAKGPFTGMIGNYLIYFFQPTAAKHGVTIEDQERDYCRPTDFTAPPYRLVEQVLHENFPDVIVAPYLLTAGTDARRFSDVADSILRFAPIDLDKAQFASIHGANEHIKIQNIGQCVLFYKGVIQKLKECQL